MMLQSRRCAVGLMRNLRFRQQRRYDSSYTSSGHAASAGHVEPIHHGHHPEPVNESFGRGFYITLATIPLLFAFYKFSNNSVDDSTQPFFTRLIKSYTTYREKNTERNTLHTKMIEQAAYDRNLFQSSPGSRMVDLKFPEVFNTGSPYNVQAGQSANLDEVIAHYQKQNALQREKQIKNSEER